MLFDGFVDDVGILVQVLADNRFHVLSVQLGGPKRATEERCQHQRAKRSEGSQHGCFSEQFQDDNLAPGCSR